MSDPQDPPAAPVQAVPVEPLPEQPATDGPPSSGAAAISDGSTGTACIGGADGSSVLTVPT